MGRFDSLIDSNKEPKVGVEYIYLHDLAWKKDVAFESFDFEYGSVVIDVKKNDNDSLEFTCKKSGERFRTNYGWSFAENTPDNAKKINAYLESDKKLDELKKETVRLQRLIVSLKGPSKI